MGKAICGFAENFRKILQLKGLKQKDVADNFPEYTQATINKWVNGINRPNYEDLIKLSKFLGVRVDSVLDNDVEFLGNEIFQKSKTIPLINWVQAGRPTDTIDDSIIDDIAVPSDLPEGCFALAVNGDSMVPEFRQNDILIVDPSIQPTTGNYVIAVTENHEKATFKKFRERFDENGQFYFELVPLNTDYPIYTSKQFKIEIIGVVRSFIRKCS